MARSAAPHLAAASLGELLSTSLPAAVARTARTLAQAQKQLDACLPHSLRGHVGVARIVDDTLYLAVDNGAVASHLRHRSGLVIAALVERGLAINQMQIKVAPERLPSRREAPVKPGLPGPALGAITTLYEATEPGPLRDALARLLAHHRQR